MKNQLIFAIQVVAVSAMGTAWGGEKEKLAEVAGDIPATAIYDPDPSHLWNRLHRAFFVRPDAITDLPNVDAVDPPLWIDTTGFLKSGPTHRAAIAVLDEFLSKDGAALVDDPVKRAVLQQDLWSVFDWSATSAPGNGAAKLNLAELRSRLATAIGRLALSAEEIELLPDNFSDAAAAKAFGHAYDPEHPREPFLPADLFDPAGPWVCVRGAVSGPSAPVHVRYYKGRSPFLVYIRLPDGREATKKYLKDLNQATRELVSDDVSGLPQFPVGTMVALVRRMAVIDSSGNIQVTPLTQTVQMRVYCQVGGKVKDHENSQAAIKFRLSRRGLFAGRHGGFEPISWDEPLRISLLQHGDIYHNQGKGRVEGTVMQSCIACHSCGGATIESVFSYKQDEWVPGANAMAANRLRLTKSHPSSEIKNTVQWKMARYEWGLLTGLLGRGVVSSP